MELHQQGDGSPVIRAVKRVLTVAQAAKELLRLVASSRELSDWIKLGTLDPLIHNIRRGSRRHFARKEPIA